MSVAIGDPSDVAKTAERERSSSLRRGLDVLRALLDEPFGLTLATVAARTDLSRAAARRFLLTLCDEGLVRQSDRAFLPTLAVRDLGTSAITGPDLWSLFDADMHPLTIATGESCSIATLDGDEIEYVARCQGPRVLAVSLAIGSHLPACHTSMGRVLLASLPPERARDVVGDVPHAPRTGHSLVDPARLLEAIDAAREQGYALIDQELENELVSVAVPLLAPSGACLAALNVSSTPSRLTVRDLEADVVPRLVEASAAMTSRLAGDLSRFVRARDDRSPVDPPSLTPSPEDARS